MNKVRKAVISDCSKLIENFSDTGTVDFQTFCTEWKNLYFQHIYSGLNQCPEFVQMTEEFFSAAKEILLNSNRSELDRIGALYLLYALYFKQPTKEYCKIKICVNSWNILKSFISDLKKIDGREQAVLIFYKLIQSNAFRFVATEIDYGFEDFYELLSRTKDKPLLIQKIQSLLKNDLKEINDDASGLLSGIRLLENDYNEKKSKIPVNENERLDSTQIFDTLKSGFMNIINILEDDKEVNKKSRNDDSKSVKNTKLRTIKDKREEIKARAKEIDQNSKDNDKKGSGEYDITLIGDFIKMTQRKDPEKLILQTQPVSNILNEILPEDIMDELNPNETIEPIPSTSKGIKKPATRSAKRPKIEDNKDEESMSDLE